MYKRKQKPAPAFLSLSSKGPKKDLTSKPPVICEAVIEANNENDSGNANDMFEDSEDGMSILATQQPENTTQRRYFSQRSNANRTQASLSVAGVSTTRKIPTTYFENTLLRCGVIFDNPMYIVLGCDHINFVNKLRTMLESAPDFPENVNRFVSGLRDYMKDEQQMSKVLTVCMINVPNCDFLPQSQDCLMRNFLMVDFLESKVVELLLDTLATICSTSNPTDQNICSALLILGQMGFINKRNNSEQLFSQIVALLGLTEDIFRNEIIKFLPEILDVKKHDCAVERIICLMGSDPQKYLNQVTVNAFEAMQLSPRLRCQLKTRILRYIQEEQAHLKLYPVFTNFLLNCDSTENHVELITRFRKIDWCPEDSSLAHETQKEVFLFIMRALKRSKELTDGWIKSILNADRAEDCYPGDVVVLILLSSINEDRSLYLEGVLRRKIKCCGITRETFSKAITGFPLVIAQHLKVFFEFIDNMFRLKDDLFEFGEIGYKLAFGIPNCDHKLLLSKLIAFVCEKNNDYVVRRALMLLQEICDDFPDVVQRNSLQILRLLDKVNDVGLFEYRLIMDLLSSIAYPPPPALPIDGVASHIDILVRKQVTGSGNNIRRHGIVGSVRVMDHLIWHADINSAKDDRDTDVTIAAIEDLPPGNARTAANVVELMLLSSENCPNNRAMCYDELAAALSPRSRNGKLCNALNRGYLSWLKELITWEFQALFTVDELPTVEGVTLGRMFQLNREDEYTESNTAAVSICINIGGLVLSEEYKTRPTIATLSPIFNVMRILCFHSDGGNLEAINAVLGCPVIFPQFINSPEDLDVDGGPLGARKMDILFYTANWFREIVCAFASQRELNIRVKVLRRLGDLIALEQNIRNMLRLMPAGYSPPTCHFLAWEKHEVDGGKRAKAATGAAVAKGKAGEPKTTKEKNKKKVDSIPNNSTLLSGDQSLGNLMQSSRVEEKKNAANMSGFYGPKEVYRQLDLDILILLKEALCTSHPLPLEKVGTCLGLEEFRFIAEDLILKLETVTGLKKASGFQQEQFVVSSAALVVDVSRFLNRFVQFLDQLSDTIQRNQEVAGDEEAALYTDEMNLLKRCLGVTLRLLSAFFSWQGFHQEKHQEVFKRSLLTILKEDEDERTVDDRSIPHLCKRVIDALLTRLPSVMDLYSAVHMYHLIVALSGYTGDHSKSVKLCERFLKRVWHSHTGAAERGGEANSLLNELLKGLFRNMDLENLKRRLDMTVAETDGLNGKEGKLKSLPNFNKSNIPILFRALANSVYELTVGGLEKDMTTVSKLEFWESVYEAQNSLLDIVQAVNVPRNFTLFLRYSQLVLKLFLQHGMTVVEGSLKTHTERVRLLLKAVQGTTRFLHKLCCQSKSVKNSAVIALIPSLRQSVESFNYSVKAAMVANKCSSAFLLGNLKNNDLHGEAILSQVVSATGPEDEDDAADDIGDGEFPSDDDTLAGASYLGITTMCHRAAATPAVEDGPGTSGRRRTRARK